MKDSNYPKNFSYILSGLVFALATLSPGISDATTYYVAKTGNDSNPGTEFSPFRNIKHGVSSLSAGDTLYVKAGTYNESILSWKTPIPNGTSWNNPVTVAANPGDTVTILPRPGQAFFWVQDGQAKYLIIDGFIIDGQNTALHGFKFSNNTRRVRVQNTEIKNTGHGVLITICSGCPDPSTAPMNTYHEFINMKVHHNGTFYTDHGFYITTSFNLIEHSEIYSNAGYGIHVYSGKSKTANYNVSRYNTVHDNGTDKSHHSCGIILSSGHGNEAYGNVIYRNLMGLCSAYKDIDSKIYNNVVYDNIYHGISVGITSTGSKVRNNTFYNNGIYGVFIGNGAVDAVVQNNIAYLNKADEIFLQPNKQTGTTVSHNLTIDPRFHNIHTKDFHLQKGSLAIDSGYDIPNITQDFDGAERAVGAYDIGAYEFQGISPDLTAPSKPSFVVVR